VKVNTLNPCSYAAARRGEPAAHELVCLKVIKNNKDFVDQARHAFTTNFRRIGCV
jgi:hypothetical protein